MSDKLEGKILKIGAIFGAFASVIMVVNYFENRKTMKMQRDIMGMQKRLLNKQLNENNI